MKKYYISFLILLSTFPLLSQRGKDGVGNITAANTVVNIYTPLNIDANPGDLFIGCVSTAGFSVGDLIMIIQMQGASVNASKAYFIDTSMTLPQDTSMGYVTNYNQAGNYEFAEVNSMGSNFFGVDCAITKAYRVSGKVQIVRVPRYTTLTVSGAGYLTCPAWNGSTGGVLATESQSNTTISSTPAYSVTGKGFRGGGVENKTTGFGTKWGSIKPGEGGYKGESIAGDTSLYKTAFSGVFCRGAIANGGGGGDSENGGGGGGSNGGSLAAYKAFGNPAAGYNAAWNIDGVITSTFTSSGGGRGGYTSSTNNGNPNLNAPGTATAWAADARRNFGGVGGRPLDYSTGRIFLGGGGGTGDSNDGKGAAGGNGGGLVYIVCYGDLTGAGTINADGANGGTSNGTCGSADGASGGGGGGTVILNVVGTTNLTAATAILARGGTGGNNSHGGACLNTQAMGPGGGGGGGYIGYTGVLPANNLTGGANGIVTGNASNIATTFPPNGATAGGGGSTGVLNAVNTITSTPSVTICVNNSATLTAGNPAGLGMGWVNQATGGFFSAFGPVYTTSVFTTPGTYTMWAGFCPEGTYRSQSVIYVTAGPTLTVNSPTICPGQTITLNGGGATTYTWNTGPNTSSISVSPTTTTTYTLSGSIATCSANLTSTVTVSPSPTITATPVSICNGQTATVTASGASTYTWNTGPTTSSIVVTPTTTTNYTVTGSVGTCTAVQTTTVTVNSLPTVTASTGTICSGQTATLTAGGASTYTWNTGPTTATIALSPTITTNYTVTGSNGACSKTQTTSITVNSLPTVTASSSTICSGQTATLTAGGASTYTWNTGPTTATIALSPTTTTNYTVTGNNGTCSNTQTTSITVNSLPTVTVSSGTICSGQTATLTAGGASTFTWNTGPTTATIALSPTTTTNYTVTGSNGSCSNTQTTSITVNSLPTVTASSGTICSGQTVTLTAGGASTYTWNTGPTTSTVALSPTVTTNYTVTGSNGTCSNTKTTSIIVNALPTVTATNNGPLCPGQTLNFTGSAASSYTWAGPSFASNTQNPTIPVSTTSNSGTYTFAVTDVNGCINNITTTVVVNPSPTIAVNSPTLCTGQTATLTASGASTYTWNPGNLSGGSVTVSPTSTQNYTVTATSSLSCQGTNTTNVTVTSTPTLNVPSATICPGNTATLTAGGATSFTWNPGGSTGTTFTAAPSSNTTYTVTGANGSCVSTQTTAINIGSAISISVNNPTICAGETTTLTASGATTYTWSTSSNSSSITVNPSSTTVYTISGTNGSCSGANTATVTVNTAPTVTTGVVSGICSGQTATLTAGGASTYTWNPGNLSGGSVTVSPTSTQNYTVIGTSVTGCTNTASASVTVTATPTIVVQPISICPGGTGTLNATGASSYTWNPGNATGSSFTASPSSTTNYTVTGSNGVCVSTATVDMTVGSSLTVSINSPTICAGQTVTLTATSSATSYTWNTGANTNTVVVTPTTTTSYSVDIASVGCNGSGTTTVFVNALPTVTVNGSAICSGQTVTLTAGGATNYTWTPSGVNGSTFIATPTTNTTYSVIGEAGGCNNTASFDVTVTPTPSLTVNSPTICGGSTTLTASGATNYTWSPGGQNTSSIVVSPSSTTTYTLVGANGSCLSFTTTDVNVTVAPPLIITMNNPSPFCPGSCSNFTTTAGFGSVTFDYGDATGTTTNTTHCYTISGTYTVSASGTYTSGCSISSSTVITLSFLPVNTVTFDVITVAPYEVNSVISFTSYGISANWSFDDGTSLTNAFDPTHAYNSGGTYCVKMVTPTTSLSCGDSLTKCIDIIQPVSINIPNVFTPNGDSKNDIFKVTGSGIIDFHCVILDRWGLRMIEWDGINGSWDGYTKNGTQAPSGTYFYIIDYRTSDGKGEVVKGPVSLFKE
jgi:gliding motility-associated-like protein